MQPGMKNYLLNCMCGVWNGRSSRTTSPESQRFSERSIEEEEIYFDEDESEVSTPVCVRLHPTVTLL